jgi:hypothetical protein
LLTVALIHSLTVKELRLSCLGIRPHPAIGATTLLLSVAPIQPLGRKVIGLAGLTVMINFPLITTMTSAGENIKLT